MLVGPHVQGRYLFIILVYEYLSSFKILFISFYHLDSIVVSPIQHIDIVLAKSKTRILRWFFCEIVFRRRYVC